MKIVFTAQLNKNLNLHSGYENALEKVFFFIIRPYIALDKRNL